VGADADAGAGPKSLAAALDEVIVATSALVRVLSERGGPRERRVAAQLALALVGLAAARGSLAPEQQEVLTDPRPIVRRAPHGDRG
jgi:hypothetical protein